MSNFEIEKFNQYNLKENATQSICPLCSHDRKPENKNKNCTSLDWQRGLGTCHNCNETFQLHTYKKRNNEKQYKRPDWSNNTELSENAVKYFEKRGISQFTLRHMKISEGIEFMPQLNKEVNTIQFNFFQFDELINIKYRDARKNFKLYKDAEKIFYNLNGIYQTKEVIIVEGEFDCLSYYECGLHYVVSVPNGANKNLDYLDTCIEYFDGKDKIYIAVDKDEAGKVLEAELIRRLGIGKCYMVDFKDCKDANEYLVKYGKDELKKTITEAGQYPIDDIIMMEHDGKELDKFFIEGMPKGYVIGRSNFDENFSIDQGRFITVTGIPSHGKSEWVDEMTVGYNINYGWKTCFCSPENQPTFLHKAKILSKILGFRPKSDLLQSEWYKRAKQHIDDNFYFVSFKSGSYDLKRCLEKAKELIFRKGIKVLVLDPFNKIRLKESLNKNITEYTNDYLSMIDDFARENMITIILVAHPRKMDKENGKYSIPDFYDIKGGGEFYDMSPFGLSVYRDFELNKTIIKTLKVKFLHLGMSNSTSEFLYNINNGRYTPFGDQYDNDNYLKKEQKDIKIEFKEVEYANNEDLPFNPEFEKEPPF